MIVSMDNDSFDQSFGSSTEERDKNVWLVEIKAQSLSLFPSLVWERDKNSTLDRKWDNDKDSLGE